MIPKIIHYCWLSKDPIPSSLQGYMKSWKNFLPDYEFMLWNFDRFDKNSSIWVQEAFEKKKYAFAADYIRLYAVYNFGGFYLDMDVEVLKSFDDLLKLKSAVCWQDEHDGLEAACFGAVKGAEWIKVCLNYYKEKHFINSNGEMELKVLPNIMEDCLKENGFVIKSVSSVSEILEDSTEKTLSVLPSFFFSPKSYKTGRIFLREQTYSIHHFAGSWLGKSKTRLFMEKKLIIILEKLISILKKIHLYNFAKKIYNILFK